MSIELQQIGHLIEDQFAAEEAMRAECAKGDFTLEKPYVKLNPYLITPLTALVHFRTPEAVEAKVVVKGKEAAGDMGGSFPKATEHWLPVLGLYPGYENKVEITLGDGKKNTITIRTEEAPARVMRPESIQTTAEYMGDNVIIISPTTAAHVAGYDYRGDIRWYLAPNFAFDIKRIRNGRLLMGTHRLLMPPYHTSGIFEFGMIGKIYNEFRLPGGYHHDQFEMEDGNILILTQKPERGTVEDVCVLVDRKSGKIIKEWDYQKILPQNVGGSGSQDEHDWFHNNAVWYDKKTNTLTLSGRHQDAVINIDYDSAKLNWIIGDPEGWPEDMQKKYFFKPVGDVKNFDWQREQHACVITPSGDVMCFDNGQYRSKHKDKYIKNRDNFSRGVRYRIDTKKMEIEQVWQYGKELGETFFSPYICNVEYYAEGHYLIHSGGIGWMDGYAADMLGPFVPVGPNTSLSSKTVEEKDGVVMYYMEVEGNFYRAEKLSAYHDGDNCAFGEGKMVGKLEVTPVFDTLAEGAETNQVIDSWHQVHIEEDEDRFVFHGRFERGSLVQILLQSDKETRPYYVNTAATWALAMCSGAFLENDERTIKKNISKEGLSGIYEIKVLIEGKIWKTGVSICC